MSDTYSVFDSAGVRVGSGLGRADALDKWETDGRAGTVAREIDDGPETPVEKAGFGTVVAAPEEAAQKPKRTRSSRSKKAAATK